MAKTEVGGLSPADAAGQYNATPTLTGQHVALEGLALGHAEALAVAVTDGDEWADWYNAHVARPENMGSDVEYLLNKQRAGAMATWAVRRLDTGKICGLTAFGNIDAPNLRVEIGYTWLAASAQGTAINPEMKLLLLTRAFEVLGCRAVELRTHFHNRRSRAAIEKLGAKQDGILRSHRVMPDGTRRDTVVYSILDIEWPTVRTGLRHRLTRY